jgi:FtsZ-binding cell division protein ZapB
MIDLLLPYLIAIASFVVVVLISFFSQRASEHARMDYEDKASVVPDFLRYADLRADLDELELKLADRREEAARSEALIEEADRKREWLQQNEDILRQTEEARAEKDRLDSQLSTLLEQVTEKEEILRKLKDTERDAEWTCKLLTQQAEEASRQKEEALRRCEAARKELTDLQAKIDEERKNLSSFKGMAAEQKVECDRLLTQQERLDKDITTLKNAKSALTQSVQNLEDKQSALRKEVAALDARSAALSETLRAAAGGGMGTVEDPLDEVKVGAVQPGVFVNAAASIDESDALSALKQQLREEDLVFHPRVIDAFHTALKVQNESPLLVLAGISGTGKSLLPQRYARALGMHSLMVPVQPRWDSPQDLLGFFNYLEGRYKPTELTRALVQFDQYAEIEIPENQWLHDRMLLVLLDEMNLARVEYYFSEFLSRLEARRNLRELDTDGRRRASLTIEVGAAGGTTQEHRVFVGRNVLFVGTINEDESTQTLSDKVVDRANVMRFGRPGKLERPTAKRQAGSLTKNFLDRTQWTHWIDETPELRSDHNSLAIKMIGELNDAMKEVGRPFAYRTRDAILAYVRQYPDRSDARIKLALADQIEQRVLPKLRGIDPTDVAGNSALRRVRDVVDQLGDAELGEAIEQGKSGGHGHSFLWHGVDRRQDD